MSDKQKEKNRKPAPSSETEAEKKVSETVNLSAEELKRISGGAAVSPSPKPITNP
jgi:hypothetical protein